LAFLQKKDNTSYFVGYQNRLLFKDEGV